MERRWPRQAMTARSCSGTSSPVRQNPPSGDIQITYVVYPSPQTARFLPRAAVTELSDCGARLPKTKCEFTVDADGNGVGNSRNSWSSGAARFTTGELVLTGL